MLAIVRKQKAYKQKTIVFHRHTVELWRNPDVVVTKFKDGTEATAIPHDTPEYHKHAIEKTGKDDVLLYCWQHDLMHVIYSEMKGRHSLVLWNIAHGLSTETPECDIEEREAQALQKEYVLGV